MEALTIEYWTLIVMELVSSSQVQLMLTEIPLFSW